MTTRDLMLEGLEQAINRLLDMDPAARAALAKLHGRTVRIDLSGTGLYGDEDWVELPKRYENRPLNEIAQLRQQVADGANQRIGVLV